MAIVRITGVDSSRGSDEEIAYCLDEPQEQTKTDSYRLSVSGWVLGRREPALAVELWLGEQHVCRLPVDRLRGDIADRHGQISWSGNTGFQGTIGVLKLPSPFHLRLQAVLADDRRVPLATVRGERRPPPVDTQSVLQPIMLTSLGRSGSTWVTRLLGRHPAVLAYRPFEYEARLSSYWLEIAGTLAEPASYLQALRGYLSSEYWWIGSRDGVPQPLRPADPEGEEWLHRTQTEALAGFAVGRIEDFYRRLAAREEKSGATHFVEKCAPQSFVPDLVLDLYPRAREVFLVRDFRDVVCSILAYNTKRGFQAFGRDRASDDVAYAYELRKSVARLQESWSRRRERACLLRYEDLIRRPTRTLSALFEHLQLDGSPETVNRILEEAEALTPDAQEQHQTSESPAHSIGRWSRDLSPELQEACAGAYGDALAAFEYET